MCEVRRYEEIIAETRRTSDRQSADEPVRDLELELRLQRIAEKPPARQTRLR
ncbi:MAG: hypothetical protein AB7G06_05430 [Bdellovibrionales bacterium]